MGGRWRTPIGGGQGIIPVFLLLLRLVLPVALVGLGEDARRVDGQASGRINDDLDVTQRQLVFAGGYSAASATFGAFHPPVELVDAGFQLAIAANSLNGYATRSGAGAIIFHDEVILNRGADVDFLSRLHHVLHLRSYREGNGIAESAGATGAGVKYGMSDDPARR